MRTCREGVGLERGRLSCTGVRWVHAGGAVQTKLQRAPGGQSHSGTSSKKPQPLPGSSLLPTHVTHARPPRPLCHLGGFVANGQQVGDFLVVELQVRGLDRILLGPQAVQVLENLVDGTGDDARRVAHLLRPRAKVARHGKGLTRPRLACSVGGGVGGRQRLGLPRAVDGSPPSAEPVHPMNSDPSPRSLRHTHTHVNPSIQKPHPPKNQAEHGGADRACRPTVCKNCAVEAFQHLVHHGSHGAGIQFLLVRFSGEHLAWGGVGGEGRRRSAPAERVREPAVAAGCPSHCIPASLAGIRHALTCPTHPVKVVCAPKLLASHAGVQGNLPQGLVAANHLGGAGGHLLLGRRPAPQDDLDVNAILGSAGADGLGTDSRRGFSRRHV